MQDLFKDILNGVFKNAHEDYGKIAEQYKGIHEKIVGLHKFREPLKKMQQQLEVRQERKTEAIGYTKAAINEFRKEQLARLAKIKNSLNELQSEAEVAGELEELRKASEASKGLEKASKGLEKVSEVSKGLKKAFEEFQGCKIEVSSKPLDDMWTKLYIKDKEIDDLEKIVDELREEGESFKVNMNM